MKKILLAISLFFVTAALSSAQTNILNGSFETWTSYPMGEYPTYWSTSDSLYQVFGGPHSAVREGVDKCDLLYSLKLTSVTALGNDAPGVATNGRVVGLNVIDKGTPDTTRYERVTGCYKYTGVGSDVGFISVFLLKYNTTTGERDTVAASVTTTTTNAGVTNFSTNFVYREPFKPDTFLAILNSSPGIGNAEPGSTLIIDNLSMSGWVGIEETLPLVKTVKLYPTPASEELHIETEVNRSIPVRYEISDVTGKRLSTGSLQTGSQSIDVRKLASGNYLFVIRDDEGAQLYSGKFSVTH